MRKSFYCITAILMLINTSITYAQRGFRIGEEMKAPSTDTWNFIKQGEVGANLHTGTVNLSIPVYVYQDKDFELPITLNYSSNGLVCNMRAGVLGPDWTLNAGGSISIEVRGMQDFNSTEYADSYYQYHLAENPGQDGTYWRYTNLAAQSAGLGALSPEIIYVPDPNQTVVNAPDKYDAEPDIFHFNFMGYSGSFHLGRNNALYLYNTNGENRLLDISISISKEDNLINITFTDKYGYKYLFSENNSDKAPDYEEELKLDVAYKLSEITAPNGRCMKFEYDTADMDTYRPASFNYTGPILSFRNDNVEEIANPPVNDMRILESRLEGDIISKISVDSKPIVSFTYDELPVGEVDQYEQNPGDGLKEFTSCKRLQQITILNPFSYNDTLKTATFTYKPTGGARTNYLMSASISGEGTYSFDYHNMEYGTFPPIGTRKIDHWGYYNNQTGGYFLKIVSTNPQTLEESINTNVRNPRPSYAKYGMLEKITYPTGGYSVMEYEGHDYSHAMRRTADNAFNLKMVDETGICGGMRIKSVTNYSENNAVLNSKTYLYTKDSASSGILLHFPKYWLSYSAAPDLNFSELNINFYSNSLFHHNGSHIEYESVTQVNSDGSKEMFHYSNSRMSRHYRDETIVTETVPERMPGCGTWHLLANKFLIANITRPVMSKNAERGKLLKHEIFKAEDVLPEKTMIFQYDTNNLYLTYDTYPVYLVRQFGHAYISTDNYKLINTTIKEHFADNLITTEENIEYNSFYQPSQITRTRSDGTSEIIRYEYASDYKGRGGIYDIMNQKHFLAYPITEQVYWADDSGTEILISGKRYTYKEYNDVVKLFQIEQYNSQSGTWQTEVTYTDYDTQGNLLESMDANGLTTSYIWGYSGLYMVAKLENVSRDSVNSIVGASPLEGCLSAEQISSLKSSCPNSKITIYEYKPLVGLSKVIQPDGETFTYRYNNTGKLMGIYNTNGEMVEENLYSPDNRQ